MSTDTFVVVPSVSTGVKIDNSLIVRDGVDIHRQRVETFNGTPSTNNSTSVALTSAGTWTGASEDVSGYGSVIVACKSDQAGTLYMEFSPDNVNWDSSLGFTVAAGVNEVHRLSVTRQYYRARYVNGATGQGYLRLQSTLSNAPALTSALNSSVQADADSLVTRSVLMGQTDSGQFNFVPVNGDGHLEVAVHGPLLPFGSLHTERTTPIFQIDPIYGINLALVRPTSAGSGTVTASNNLFTCATGATAGSAAVLQSRNRLRYRPGQGAIMRFTTLWDSPAAGYNLIAGMATGEGGFFWGYNDTSFGVLHLYGGTREVQTLTITTPSTSTQDVQVTLNGTVFTATGITNSGSAARTAYEIAYSMNGQGEWNVEAIGTTVVFLAGFPGDRTGAFSVAQSGAGVPVAGTFAETVQGVTGTYNWVPQSQFNGDKLDGTGPSGFVIDPSKGNIFQITMQYLGFGVVEMSVETQVTGRNPMFTAAHRFSFPNTLTAPHTKQPSMPFTMWAQSTGGTTGASMSSASIAGFIEGELAFNGPRMSYDDSSTTVSTGAYWALMTVRNDFMYNGRPNQTVINLMSFGGAHDDATPVTLYLIKDGKLVGTPNFAKWSSTSATYVDTAATQVTITDNNQILFSVPLGGSGDGLYEFGDRVMLQPGESVTLAAKTVTGTSTWTIATLNTREDQ